MHPTFKHFRLKNHHIIPETMYKTLVFLLAFLAFACHESKKSHEHLIEEIRSAEKAFNDMAADRGVKAAFLEFAAEDAVISRNGKVIEGKAAIAEYFENQTLTNVQLQWEPSFIDVAEAGDMAYTYGPYTFQATDTTGQQITSQGYFHTVWKRQKDGSWKYVWD